MRTKLWSTLLALVLLCACVVCVLILGAQAEEGTTYEWVVNGEATDTTSSDPNEWTFVSIDKAIQYAKSQTAFTWEKDDQLIVHIAAKDTTAATATTRLLFNAGSVFRADNTLLPITIDGDDPDTATVERNGFALNGSGFVNTSDNNKNYGVACGNSYYFKGMDLNWGATSFNFRAGCGHVTFDDVTFGGTSMQLSADATSSAIFSGWTTDNFNAMKNSEGVYEITLTLKNLTYTASATNLVSARNWSSGFTVSAASFGVADTRSKLVIGTGATVSNVSIAVTSVSQGVASDAYCLDVEGGTITTVYGVRASSNVYGDIITRISSGTVTNFCPGSNSGTLHGNVTNTVTGGSVTGKYRGGSIANGTINGNITNYIYGGSLTECRFGSESGVINGDVTNYLGTQDKTKTPNISGFVGGNHKDGAINGDIINHLYSAKVTASYYCGPRMGLAENVINYFYDGFDASSVVNAYCGGNSASGSIKYSIINNFKGGKFGSHLYCGSLSTVWAALGENETAPEYRIINNVEGGSFYRLYCAGNGAGVTDGAVQNNFSGDIKVNVAICGGHAVEGATVNAIENNYAANFTGSGAVYGGSLSGIVGTITNTYTGGSFATTTYAGSDVGTVKSIQNTVNGGSFEGTYFVCGNNKATFATAAGDTADTVRIQNDINGGTFKRIVGGSYNADVNGSIKSTYDTAIVATTAVYAGNASGGSIIGTVTNTLDGTVPADGKATIKVFYGGNNNGGGTIGAIVNNFKGGALRAVYGGCNYEGKPVSITNTVSGGVFGCEFFQKLEEDEAVYFCGGNRVADLACDVTTTLKSGTLVNVYAGTLLGNDSGNVKLILAPQGELTVLGKAFGITGVTSDANAPIFIGKDSYLSVTASDPSNTIYVCQTQCWDADRYVFVSGTENSINWKNVDGVTGTPAEKIVGGNTVLYYGNAASVDSVSLILTDRIAIKAYFAKDRVGDNFTYSFTGLLGDVLVSGTKEDLTAEGEYYYVVLPAIGLAEFEKPFLLCGNGLETCQMSIVDLADLGAAYYETKDTKSANLFKSIADLGRSANAGDTRYNMTPETVTYTPAEATVKTGTDVLDVQSMTLVMSNAVGISLKGEASAADTVIDVFVNGKKVTELCTVTVAQEKNANEKYDVSVDLYLNVASMSKELKIELKSGDESTTYLAMYTRADAIAQTIANNLADKKALAEDLLVYIQAVDAYKA